MSGLIGKKIGMSSFYNEDGKNVACTVIEVGPCEVTQVKTIAVDGYNALQLGYGDVVSTKNVSKPLLGHFEKAGVAAKKVLREFKEFDEPYNVGDKIDASIFSEGEMVEVSGYSKGKGFQGVVKRHGFGGVGGQTHGQHNRLRAPGSIGACSTPSRVFKGMRMGGRTGNEKVKIFNLKVLKVIADKNLLVVQGSVPGHKGTSLIIEK